MVMKMEGKAIKFVLSGRLAFFKKPDVNTKTYFTYNNIHKVALLGLLGAIVGLKGYRNSELFGQETPDYPEFYQRLSPLKISIIPNADRGYFAKKIQYFNNSVGYASKEEGGNLMVYEQWLENPSWTIYLLNDEGLDENLWDELCDYLLNNKSIYIPYLGKNDFFADISTVEEVSLKAGSDNFIHSLFIGELDQIEEDETINDDLPFIFTEYAPIGLEREHNFYTFARTIFTNCMVDLSGLTIYSDNNRNLAFF